MELVYIMRIFLAFGIALLFLTSACSPSSNEHKTKDAFIPPVVTHQSWWVPDAGQLSGLTYDHTRACLWAVSDWSACLTDQNEMVLYPEIKPTDIFRCGFIYSIPLPQETADTVSVKRFYVNFSTETMDQLITTCDLPIGDRAQDMIRYDRVGNLLKYQIDLEAIVLHPDHQHILVYAESGWNLILKLHIESDALTVVDCYHGIFPESDRDNKGIEGMTLSDDGWLWLVHENKLELYGIPLSQLEDPSQPNKFVSVFSIGDDGGMIESFCGMTYHQGNLFILDRNRSNLIRIPRSSLVPNQIVPLFYKPLITNREGNYFRAPNGQYFFTLSLEGVTQGPNGEFWFSVDPWYDKPNKYLPITDKRPYQLINPFTGVNKIKGGEQTAEYFRRFTPMLIRAELSAE